MMLIVEFLYYPMFYGNPTKGKKKIPQIIWKSTLHIFQSIVSFNRINKVVSIIKTQYLSSILLFIHLLLLFSTKTFHCYLHFMFAACFYLLYFVLFYMFAACAKLNQNKLKLSYKMTILLIMSHLNRNIKILKKIKTCFFFFFTDKIVFFPFK